MIRDLLGQRVLEGVLQIGRHAGLVQEFGSLERRETATQVVDRPVDDGLENGEGHIPPDHRGGLEEILLILGEPVDPGGENRLDRGRDLDRRDGSTEPVGATISNERPGLYQASQALFQEEGIPLRPRDQQSPHVTEARVRSEQRVKHRLGTIRRQRIQSQLRVVRLAPPLVSILRPVVHEEEHARRWDAFHQAIKERLGLGINPVEILEDHQQRLELALPEDHPLDGIQRALPALRWIEPQPLGVLDRHVEQRQHRRQRGAEPFVESQQLPIHLLVDPSVVVLVGDLEVALQQVDDGQIRSRLPV